MNIALAVLCLPTGKAQASRRGVQVKKEVIHDDYAASDYEALAQQSKSKRVVACHGGNTH